MWINKADKKYNKIAIDGIINATKDISNNTPIKKFSSKTNFFLCLKQEK